MPDRLTADMVVAQMTMLTPTSKPMVHRFVTVLLKQNPKASAARVLTIADAFKLLKFRGTAALKTPEDKKLFKAACEEMIVRKLDEVEGVTASENAPKRQRVMSEARARSVSQARSRSKSVLPPAMMRCRSRSRSASRGVNMLEEYGVEDVAKLFGTYKSVVKPVQGPKRIVREKYNPPRAPSKGTIRKHKKRPFRSAEPRPDDSAK
eukprot:EG_transcript_27931